MAYVVQDYDNALRYILENGKWKENRTGVRTLAVFGIQSRYDLAEGFPLLTKRKINYKACFAELLWFLSGSTNNKDLQELGTNIWTPWVSKDFEDKHGFAEGSFGPVYGFQLRHFGGDYNKGERGDGYGVGGFDQLEFIVNKLKNDPSCRRILWSLWNPPQFDQMRLPPCHYSFQFDVTEGKLSGVLTQRSCDFPIGVPFNIAFYSTVIMMLADICGFEYGELVHWTADSHIYEDQMEAVQEYLSRDIVDNPTLKLQSVEKIEDYKMSSYELMDYNPHPHIKIPVAV